MATNYLKGDKMKKFAILLALATFSNVAFAQSGTSDLGVIKYAAYFLAVSIAALGAGLGQARVFAAALEGLARNPSANDKIFTPMILGAVFIETLVIFTLISTFIIQ